MNIRSYVKKYLKLILGRDFFYNNASIIEISLAKCKTVLDLGCGISSPYIKYFHKETNQATGIDLFSDACIAARASMKYSKVVESDAIEYLDKCSDDSFDAVIALDIVEHIPKETSLKLLIEMERVASKVIIVVTPNGFWPGILNSPSMEHLCGWTLSELMSRGYKVMGAGGLALLRSKQTSLLRGCTLSSLPFQILIFNITQWWVVNKPQFAYGLTAIKRKDLL